MYKSMSENRDYNKEFEDNTRKYGYRFDFDVMHHYMIKSFKPFFVSGNVLELGSFKGAFTKRLLSYFDDITCVEASEKALAETKHLFPPKVKFINSVFEKLKLEKRYDNIIMTHVLEHLDKPVEILRKINNEWLSENGYLFLVVPNAHAASRQIAVSMGIIPHVSAVTKAEKEHGHRITYTFDTLERDVKQAGLKIVFKTGIFFKPLANYQWDKLLDTDIITNEYLEGCYQLGMRYPELSSSIFFLCEKGE